MIAITTILLSALSGFLYRLGGLSKEQAKEQIPWCPSWLINSKTRDIGCSLLAIGWMLLFYPKMDWYIYFISFGLMWGALTTYHDYINGDDNFWLHGFGVAFALIPFAIVSGDWVWFGVRCLALAVLMGVWCAIFKNDWVEELGRGAFIIATQPILLTKGGLMPEELLNLFGSKYVQMFTTISTIYLLFYVFIKGVRDAIDSTPQTDDNAFEKFVTLLGKLAKLFALGDRPKKP